MKKRYKHNRRKVTLQTKKTFFRQWTAHTALWTEVITRQTTKTVLGRVKRGQHKVPTLKKCFGSRAAHDEVKFSRTQIKSVSLLFLAIWNSCQVWWIQRYPSPESSWRCLYKHARLRGHDSPPSTAFCPDESDTKRHEEGGPGVQKQECHSMLLLPAMLHPLKIPRLIDTQNMLLIIAFHWSLACLGQTLAFRHPVLNTRGGDCLAQKSVRCTINTEGTGTQHAPQPIKQLSNKEERELISHYYITEHGHLMWTLNHLPVLVCMSMKFHFYTVVEKSAAASWKDE